MSILRADMSRSICFAGILFWLVASGCAPKLGDECEDALECAVDGSRLCDTTQPGGYCVIPGCRADECPEEGVCVEFGSDEGVRSFCMRHCGNDGDCRGSYACVSDDPMGELRTEIIDEYPQGDKFCLVRQDEAL